MSPFHRLKHALMAYNEQAGYYERKVRRKVTDEITAEIMLQFRGSPSPYCTDDGCTDHARYEQSRLNVKIAHCVGYGLPLPDIPVNQVGCTLPAAHRAGVSEAPGGGAA